MRYVEYPEFKYQVEQGVRTIESIFPPVRDEFHSEYPDDNMRKWDYLYGTFYL